MTNQAMVYLISVSQLQKFLDVVGLSEQILPSLLIN